MSEPTQPPTVRDNRLKERFDVESEGHTAFVKYHLSPGQITFIHTIVPPALEGRGIGSALARAALDSAREQRLEVLPKCAFIRGYLDRHPEYQDLTGPDARRAP
jgi:predicted GNAT family acetyltransferase